MNADIKKNPVALAGVFLEKDGRYLLVKEAGGRDQGLWMIPAGKIEFGEEPLKVAKRELKEETGGEFQADALLGIYSIRRMDREPLHPINPIMFVFKGKYTSTGTQPVDPEIADAQWFTEAEIMKLPLRSPLAMQKMIEDYKKGMAYSLPLISYHEEGK